MDMSIIIIHATFRTDDNLDNSNQDENTRNNRI